VRLVEKPPLSFDYGLRYRTDDVENLSPTVDEVKTKGFEGVLRTQFLQPLRRADNAVLSLFLGEERERVRLGYQVPLFFGRPLPLEFSVETGEEARERKGIEVDSRSDEFIVLQRKTLGPQTRLLYGIQFLRGRVDEVTGLTPEEEEDLTTEIGEFSTNNRFTVSLVHDGRDEITNPTHGMLLTGTAQAGWPGIGSDTDFTRVNGQFSMFVPIGRSKTKLVWASSYRAGAIWSGDPVPDPLLDLEDRFTAGGPFSVRGFDTNELGPTFPEDDGFPIGGRGVLIFNQELRFPIWGGLWGGVFYDAGNVFEEADLIRFDELRHSYGVGLRYDLGFGVLRVDAARIIDREPGEAKERFHLSFGHAF
jgi:outer membrane protein assembly factor BamA